MHLLALVGLAPAVASGTLFALRCAGQSVDAVTVVTTRSGLLAAQHALAGPGGALAQINAMVLGDLAPMAPPSLSFVVLRGIDGQELDDIRTGSDHGAILDMLDQLVRGLTAENAPPLHASLAGGRKTMTAALTLIMSLHARPCDRLSHVLAGRALEANSLASIPNPSAGPDHDVNLIELPLVRLAALLSPAARDCPMRDLVNAAQSAVDSIASDGRVHSSAHLELAAGLLTARDRALRLRPLQAALLALLAQAGQAGLSGRDLPLDQLARLHRIAGATRQTASALVNRLAAESSDVWLREQISRLRGLIARRWPAEAPVDIETVGRRPQSRYRLVATNWLEVETSP